MSRMSKSISEWMTHLHYLLHVELSHIILAQNTRQTVSALLHRHLQKTEGFWTGFHSSVSFLIKQYEALLLSSGLQSSGWIPTWIFQEWKAGFKGNISHQWTQSGGRENTLTRGQCADKKQNTLNFQLSTWIHWTLLLEGMAVAGNGVIYAKENKDFV